MSTRFQLALSWSAQKFAAGLILIDVITAMTLPNRQTVPVLSAVTRLVTGSEHTAITGNL